MVSLDGLEGLGCRVKSMGGLYTFWSFLSLYLQGRAVCVHIFIYVNTHTYIHIHILQMA